MTDQLQQALADLDEETALKLVQERLAAKQDPQSILASCRDGMALVDTGKNYYPHRRTYASSGRA